MDRVRPETLLEIKKKERAYPHEIRAMVAELEACREDRPFEEPQPPAPHVKPGLQVMDEMFVLAVPMSAMGGMRLNGQSVMSTLSNMKHGAYEQIEAFGGRRFITWRVL